MNAETHALVVLVLADASKEHKNIQLGMFFRVTDAEAFVRDRVSTRDWQNVRIEPGEVHLSEIHDAHAMLLTQEQQAARAKFKAASAATP